MTVLQVLKKIAVEKLKNFGFEFIGPEGPGRWVFKKAVTETVTYIVSIKKNRFGKALDSELMVKAVNNGSFISVYAFLNDSEFTRLKYEDSDGLEVAMEFLTDIITTKGLDHLNKDSAQYS